MAKASATEGTPLLEWRVGGAGALLFCAVLGVLLMAGLSGADAPPSIEMRVERVTQVQGGYVLEFTAENSGDHTAAAVEIIAELRGADGSRETARAHFEHLPPHSIRRGGVFLSNDPRAGSLVLRAQGYADP